MDFSKISVLLEAQQKVISMIALGSSLPSCLDAVCHFIEVILADPNAKTSILLLDGNQLHHGAAPSLPEAYCKAIDGVIIGPNVGSCGTAAYTKKQVIVTDIERDVLWADFKDIALANDLRACWSTPILSSSNDVLGSFAIYYSEATEPECFDFDLIDHFTNLSSIAIEQNRTLKIDMAAKAFLQQSNEKFSAFTKVMPDLALIIRDDGMYVDVYGTNKSELYEPKSNIIGRTTSEIFPRKKSNELMGIIGEALESHEVKVFEYQLDVSGENCTYEARIIEIKHYHPNNPNARHVLWMERDISERKRAEEQIEQLAFYDELTSLPNRRLLLSNLQFLIDNAKRKKHLGAVLFMDLDDFKRINDSLGHSVGDELLVMVADRVNRTLRPSDTFSRIGGDEFVILLEFIQSNNESISDQAALVASKVIEEFSYAFELRNGKYNIGTSVGISIVDGKDITAEELLQRADTAMYRSKKQGGSGYAFFDPVLQQVLDLRLDLEKGIVQSLNEGHFAVHFQPQIDMNNRVIGAEALLRWRHPDKGIILPLDFIPLAEQFGLIHQLQDLVLKETCIVINELQHKTGFDHNFPIAINISAIQFRSPSFETGVVDIVADYKVQPRNIKLEVTESMVIDNIEKTVKLMHRLNDKGFTFSIDDFGTGHSSLAYLNSLPVNELKIDKSFVNKILTDKTCFHIVDAVTSLSKHLEFNVVAEGVESLEQAKMLKSMNIYAMQGYYFAKPMPKDQFIEWISQHLK